ncbi:energy transducer TonB [Neisseriaceae bacterium TC5R-5]|nr:energy transducer TonB [Neisseriaceae bacterium TC5R-5]
MASLLLPHTQTSIQRPRLALMLFISSCAHLLLLSIGLQFIQAEADRPTDQLITIKIAKPTLNTPLDTKRLSPANSEGGGNSSHPQQLASYQETLLALPLPANDNASSTLDTHDQTFITRLGPSAQPSLSSVHAAEWQQQTGKQAEPIGDSALKNQREESGQRQEPLGERSRQYSWAQYQHDWRLKVERIGNLNYPAAARQRKLYGNVELAVLVAADGKVLKVHISRSSGHPELDQAAQYIVTLAAPFDPFPATLITQFRSHWIKQSFVFTRENQLSSH